MQTPIAHTPSNELHSIDKEIMVNAVIGKGFLSMSDAIFMTERGLARFTGNSHNERWDWNREKLTQMDLETLKELYNREVDPK